MGKPKQTSQPQNVGNAFYSSFALAIATKIDEYKSLWINEDKISNINSNGIKEIQIQTGKQADQYPSGAGKSNLLLFNGNNNIFNSYLKKITGISTIYKNLAYVFFNDAFIGDNVQSYPNYGFEVKRTHIMGWEYFGHLLDEITTFDGTKQANPAVILYYILNKIAGIEENLIDKNSFVEAAITLKQEKFGIALIINKENQLKDIIEEIIRHIDATFYFDIYIGKYRIKLYRKDYEENLLKDITEKDYKDLTFKKNSWQDLYTHINLNYIDPINYKKNSIYATNDAIRNMVKQDKIQEVNFLCIQDKQLAINIMSREYKKYCMPFAELTFKISSDSQISVFDTFNFSNKELGINKMVCRIIEISADETDGGYYEIKAIEDIYSLTDYTLKINNEVEISQIKSKEISENSRVLANVLVLNKDTFKSEFNDPLILVLDTINNDYEEANIDITRYKYNDFSGSTEDYSELLEDLEVTDNYINKIIIKNKSFLKNLEQNELEFQNGSRLININNEIIAYKKIIINENQTELIDCIRYLNSNESKYIHYKNSPVFFMTELTPIVLNNYNFNNDNQNINIKVGNNLNFSREFTFPIENVNEIINFPYEVFNLKYDEVLKKITFDVAIKNHNGAAILDSLENIEKLISSESETIPLDVSFKIFLKYTDNTSEEIITNSNNITLVKALNKFEMYIIVLQNGFESNKTYLI